MRLSKEWNVLEIDGKTYVAVDPPPTGEPCAGCAFIGKGKECPKRPPKMLCLRDDRADKRNIVWRVWDARLKIKPNAYERKVLKAQARSRRANGVKGVK